MFYVYVDFFYDNYILVDNMALYFDAVSLYFDAGPFYFGDGYLYFVGVFLDVFDIVPSNNRVVMVWVAQVWV